MNGHQRTKPDTENGSFGSNMFLFTKLHYGEAGFGIASWNASVLNMNAL